MTVEKFLLRFKRSGLLYNIFSRLLTLLTINFLWVLFRNGTAKTVKLWLKMFGINYTCLDGEFQPFVNNPFITYSVSRGFWIIFIFGILFAFPWWQKVPLPDLGKYAIGVTVLKYSLLVMLLILCMASLAGNSYNPFIYFRF